MPNKQQKFKLLSLLSPLNKTHKTYKMIASFKHEFIESKRKKESKDPSQSHHSSGFIPYFQFIVEKKTNTKVKTEMREETKTKKSMITEINSKGNESIKYTLDTLSLLLLFVFVLLLSF